MNTHTHTHTHTPGPWSISTLNSTVWAKDGERQISDCDKGPLRSAGEDLANARLIAAAPELLEIAKAYRNLLRTMASTEGELATFAHIESVLAKAEGVK